MAIDRPAVSAILLAGGQATRFQGQDKGLIALAGRPLAIWVAERLGDQVDEILISANRNLADYAGMGRRVVADTLTDFPGPLAGVLAAGHMARNDWLLIVPCDCPFLPPDLAEALLVEAERAQVGLARAADISGVHYTVMLLRRTLLDDMEAYLQTGGRSVRGWQDRHGSVTVDFDVAGRPFFNVNTPDDLAEAERWLAGAGA